MVIYPKSVTQIPFGQKSSFIGIAWDAPKGVNVARYELFISSRTIAPDQVEAFCTGQLTFVKKYPIESTVLSAVDNVTPQFTRMYYSVLAVDQSGNYVDVAFKINDSKVMALTSPRFLKEPAPKPAPPITQPAQVVISKAEPVVAQPSKVVAPKVTLPSLNFVSYTQRPEGIRIRWRPPAEGTPIKYEVYLSQVWPSSSNIPDLLSGKLDRTKMVDVPGNVTEVIDNVTPSGSKSYYTVVARGGQGEYWSVVFQVGDEAHLKLEKPSLLDPSKPVPAVAQPAPVVTKPAEVVTPRVTLPSSLKFLSYSQTIEGTRIKWAPPAEGTPVKYEVYLSEQWPSRSDIPNLLNGKLEGTKMVEVPGNVTEVIDNVTPRDLKSYYTVVARGKQGEYWEVNFEVNDARLKLENPRFLDPSNMAETEAIARQVLEEARKLASNAKAMPAQPLDDKLRQFDQAIFVGQRVLDVIPNWGDALKFIEEAKAGREAAAQTAVKARWDEELEKAREALKWHESPDGSRWRDPEGAEKIVNFVLSRMPNYPGTLELMAEIEKIKREEKEYEDAKSAGHTAQQNGKYDEAIAMFLKALTMRPEGKEAESLKDYIEDCKDMKIMEQGLKAAGSDLPKIEKLYTQFDERGRHRIAMKVLWAAYQKLGNYPSFNLLMGKLLEGDEDTEAVALFLEAQRKKGFLEQGGLTSEQLADVANKLDSLQADIEDLRGQLRDIQSQRNDYERELSEAIKAGLGAGGGSGESEWVSRVRSAIERNRNAEGRVKDQIGRIYGNMGRILRTLFT